MRIQTGTLSLAHSDSLIAADRARLVKILATAAASSFSDPKEYFRDLVNRTQWPSREKIRVSGLGYSDPTITAGKLIDFAFNYGHNPENPLFTLLGDLLLVASEDIGATQRRELAATILAYDLLKASDKREQLIAFYKFPEEVPSIADEVAQSPIVAIPKHDWVEPSIAELQSILRPKPLEFTAEFLLAFSHRAFGVCRIEDNSGMSWGTGVLIGSELVLTAHHVLFALGAGDIESAASSLVLKFGYHNSPQEQAREFKLKQDKPILSFSPTVALDYALLSVEPRIMSDELVEPIPFSDRRPQIGDWITVLHHPGQETLKVTFSQDAVVRVFEKDSRVHYMSTTKIGSSGAPCLDKNWALTILNVASLGGDRREGIIIQDIKPAIAEYF